jgi:threonyl-tRNA synthetase
MQDEAPGMVFWHPKGWSIWQQVEQYMRRVYQDNGYKEVRCPQILDRSLWEKSGHWENYRENMFTTESEKRTYAVKPMNCPGHVQIYNAGLRSYRELPLRYGEFGACHRNEASGALHGIMRIRAFTQDDGHIFCTEDQILPECVAYTALLQKVYADFGFTQIVYKLATRPEKRVGADELWDKAENALAESLRASGVPFDMLPGEGAFYGPKIEYHLKDSIGRSWQCGTIQVDFSMPGRLGAEYVAEDNTRKVPVMLHRAIVGSMERFIGILVEHYAGAMPLWLAPVQAVVLNISGGQAEYAALVEAELRRAGFRAEADLRNEKITYKIREHSIQKLPYQLIVGEQEKAVSKVAVRTRSGEDLGQMTLAEFILRLEQEARVGSAA